MELKIIMKNMENSVSSFDYSFWKQMKNFKEKGWDKIIELAIDLNRDNLDDFEEG